MLAVGRGSESAAAAAGNEVVLMGTSASLLLLLESHSQQTHSSPEVQQTRSLQDVELAVLTAGIAATSVKPPNDIPSSGGGKLGDRACTWNGVETVVTPSISPPEEVLGLVGAFRRRALWFSSFFLQDLLAPSKSARGCARPQRWQKRTLSPRRRYSSAVL